MTDYTRITASFVCPKCGLEHSLSMEVPADRADSADVPSPICSSCRETMERTDTEVDSDD